MRLDRIELTRYGAFEGKSVDFGPGLTVVLGPNESGKSTLRNAIGDVLWGFPARNHPFAFRWPIGRLLVTAKCTRSAPESGDCELLVTSRGWRDSDGVAVDPWWRGGSVQTREAWTHALSLDLMSLRDGGRRVMDGTSDLQELLFAARSGIDVRHAMNGLRSHAESLYKWHGGSKSVRVRRLLGQVETASSDAGAAVSSAGVVQSLRGEAERCGRVAEAAGEERLSADQAHEHAEMLVRAWEPAMRVHQARSRQDQLRSEGRILNSDELESYQLATRELSVLTKDIAKHEARSAQIADALTDLADDEPILEHAPRVNQLRDQRRLEQKRAQDLRTKQERAAGLVDEMGRLVAGLSPQATFEEERLTVDDLIRLSSRLLVPVDVAATIDRLAADVDRAGRELATAVAEEEKAHRNVSRSASRAPVQAAVITARTDRTERWRAIRDPWLSGDLPAPARRVSLADELEEAIREADTAADDARHAAADEGRLAAARQQHQERQEAVARAREAVEELSARWKALLREANIPETLDTEAWETRREMSGRLRESIANHESLRAEIKSDTATLEDFLAEVVEVAAALGIDTADPWGALHLAENQIGAAQERRARKESLEKQEADLARELDELLAERQGHTAVIASLTEDDDLDEVAERSAEHHDALATEKEALGQVRSAIGPGADLEAILAELNGTDLVELRAREEELRAIADDADTRRDAALAAKREAQLQLDAAEAIGRAAELRARVVEAEELLSAAVEDYLETRIMTVLLEQLLEREDAGADTALLDHAAAIAESLTSGRVCRFDAVEGDGRPSLRLEAQGCEQGSPAELSEGTADQVFLALRLAGIREHQRRSREAGAPTLPVVLDDILMAHDDARTRAALVTLVEEARDQQVILLTHHSAVANAALELGAVVSKLAPLEVASLL